MLANITNQIAFPNPAEIVDWRQKQIEIIDVQKSFNSLHIGINSFFFDSESIKANKKGVSMYFCTLVPSSDVHNSWAPLEWFLSWLNNIFELG